MRRSGTDRQEVARIAFQFLDPTCKPSRRPLVSGVWNGGHILRARIGHPVGTQEPGERTAIKSPLTPPPSRGEPASVLTPRATPLAGSHRAPTGCIAVLPENNTA